MHVARIMIVEDEVIVAKNLEILLKKMGHDVVGFYTRAEDALAEGLAAAPDLVLMDIKLAGEIDGIEAAQKIQARLSIPVIFLTALHDEYTIQRVQVSQPYAYIQKPITPRELSIAVEIALYQLSMQRALNLQLQRMKAMRSIDQAILNNADLHRTLHLVLEQVNLSLSVEASAVLLLRPFSQMLEYYETINLHGAAQKHSYFKITSPESGLAGLAAAQAQSFYLTDLKAGDDGSDQPLEPRRPWMLRQGFCGYAALPLKCKNEIKGVLEVFTHQPLPDEQDWREFLDALAHQTAIAIDNAAMLEELRGANLNMVQSYNATIESFSAALELRDMETQGHSQRVTELTIKIARSLGIEGRELEHIRRGALLHDIGKIGIPDKVLLKPGAFDAEEWQIIRKHPEYAGQMLADIPFLQPALDIPLYHHERWDGSGYPYGLKGHEIPLSARIFAVVDVWDALRSDRPYRKAWDFEKTRLYLLEQSGKQFDPEVLAVFFKVLPPEAQAETAQPIFPASP